MSLSETLPADVLPQLECQKCGHVWVPRRVRPRQCPHCRTDYWRVPGTGRPRRVKLELSAGG